MASDVVERYHSLLTDSAAAHAVEQMNDGLRKRKCYFGERPLCTVLRPNFYTPEQWAYLKSETEILLGAFRKAHDACVTVAAYREQLDLDVERADPVLLRGVPRGRGRGLRGERRALARPLEPLNARRRPGEHVPARVSPMCGKPRTWPISWTKVRNS